LFLGSYEAESIKIISRGEAIITCAPCVTFFFLFFIGMCLTVCVSLCVCAVSIIKLTKENSTEMQLDEMEKWRWWGEDEWSFSEISGRESNWGGREILA
jgi:hypothetical protein